MKSDTWDEELLAEHRAHIRDEGAREAFDALVEAAIEMPGYQCGPDWHGAIRDFNYHDPLAKSPPFAFIVNRGHLLFYVRLPGLKRVVGGLEALKSQFDIVRENSTGEWTARIRNAEEAQRLNTFIFKRNGNPVGGAAEEDDGVAETIEAILPDAQIRRSILRQLLDSAWTAERIAPSAWGATLFPDGFRLNVGQVEVFVAIGDVVRLNLVGKVGVSPFKGPLFKKVDYASVPEVSCALLCTPTEFVERRAALQEAHMRFVARAASTQSGQPRKGSPFRNSHSEALMAYARREAGPSNNANNGAGGIPEGITREDVLTAIRQLDTGVEHGIGPSTKYDLIFERRRYPPKAVVGLAAKRLAGRVLVPADFTGGQESKSFRILRGLGFLVERKPGVEDEGPDDIEEPVFKGTGKLDQQTLRGVRLLTDESAGVLTDLLAAAKEKTSGKSHGSAKGGSAALAAMRNDPEAVRAVIDTIFESVTPENRRRWEVFLADAIEYAGSKYPDRWVLSLFSKYLRFNVGMMLCIQWYPDHGVSVLLDKQLTPKGIETRDREYQNAPGCQYVVIPFDEAKKWLDKIRDASRRAIDISGEHHPGTDSIHGAHSPEVLRYLEQVLGRQLPNPSYAVDATEEVAGQEEEVFPGRIDSHPYAEELEAELAILQDVTLSLTEKEALIMARRGQGVFRANVLGVEPRCRVTGVEEPAFLVASHMKPWRDASNAERLSANNGLMLAPHVDRLFDGGYISFTDNGDLLVSERCTGSVLTDWNIPATLNVGPFKMAQRPFLAYHRQLHGFET